MPTYQYACTSCDHRFEAQQAFTDDALTECPRCSGRLRKLFGNVGVVFKGSGFYRTDARKEASGRTGSRSGSGSAGGDSGSGTSGSDSSSGSSDSGTTSTSGSGDKAAAPAPAASTPSTPASTPALKA